MLCIQRQQGFRAVWLIFLRCVYLSNLEWHIWILQTDTFRLTHIIYLIIRYHWKRATNDVKVNANASSYSPFYSLLAFPAKYNQPHPLLHVHYSIVYTGHHNFHLAKKLMHILHQSWILQSTTLNIHTIYETKCFCRKNKNLISIYETLSMNCFILFTHKWSRIVIEIDVN